MRSKNIFGLITFFVTFAFSAFIALLFAPAKIYEVPPVATFEVKSDYNRCFKKGLSYKIKEFLSQDKRNGSERNRFDNSDENDSDYAVTAARANSVSVYANRSGSMDASEFPRDFQRAWRTHMSAWHDYAEYLQSVKNMKIDSDDFEAREDELVGEINSTWQEVLQTGRNYGADLPYGF